MKSLVISVALTFLLPAMVQSEVVYITDQLKAGLHQDKSLDSPIVKLVTTGTRLEVVKRDQQLTFVRDPGGASGWINNAYLMAKAPAKTALKALQTRADTLEQRLAETRDRNIQLESELKTQGKTLPAETRAYADLKTSHAELEQKFKAEKLKVGELQIKLTELRKRVGQNSDSDALYRQIETLQEDKKKLEVQLAKTLDSYSAKGEDGIDSIRKLANAGVGGVSGLRNTIIYLLITLVLGVVAGAYLMDLINRRRHGGFRI